MDILKIIRDNLSILKNNQDPPSNNEIEIGEYSAFEFIGCGAFSSVYKVVKSGSESGCIYYALKKVEKSIENDKLVSKEVKALSSLNHRNIIKLIDYFQDELHHYLVLELAKQSFSYLKYNKSPITDESRVRQILSQIIGALEYLHNNNIIHNDIKLDNVMLNEDGDVKLVDFNLCKFINDSNDRGNGTPGFAAPEIYLSIRSSGIATGYNEMVDWFSLGVFAFILLVGDLPFDGDSIDEVYQNILNGQIVWPLDCKISKNAMDFIEDLLKANPSERLGSAGVSQIKNHHFFNGFNWNL